MDRYRHEYKYRIDRIEEEILLMRARGALDKDSHAGKDGTYYVRSLYFDDYGDSCLLDNEDGVDPRCKFRMRYYNDDIGYTPGEKKQTAWNVPEKHLSAYYGRMPQAYEGNHTGSKAGYAGR